MSPRRVIGILAAAGLFVALVVGGASLVARPGDSDDVLHRLSGIEVDNAHQVGTTLVVEDHERLISLLDLESGELRKNVTMAFGHWYAGRGPVAVLTRELELVIAHGHDGNVLWTMPEVSQTVRPVALFDDGTTVLRVCTDLGCELRALEADGSVRWNREVDDGWVQPLRWFAEEVDSGLGRPALLPDQLVSQEETTDAAGQGDAVSVAGTQVQLLEAETGQGRVLGAGQGVAGEGVVAVLDSTGGSCDLTIHRLSGASEGESDLPGVCRGLVEPVLWLVGANAVITGQGEPVLVATGDGTVATVHDGLVSVSATAAGLIGLDETSWLFGTNDGGTMAHRVQGTWLWATGSEAIVATEERKPWNVLARDSVRHEVLDPVTGDVCGAAEVSRHGGAVPLPGCRAVLVDAGSGESLIVGRS